MFNDSLPTFWSIWVAFITLLVIFGCLWLVMVVRRSEPFKEETEQTVGHEFDGIEEYDNPLPRWWYWMFVMTVVFALAYLALYPGLGNYKGLLGWTQESSYEREVAKAEAEFGPMFAQFSQTPIEELAQNDQAMRIG